MIDRAHTAPPAELEVGDRVELPSGKLARVNFVLQDGSVDLSYLDGRGRAFDLPQYQLQMRQTLIRFVCRPRSIK